MDVSYFKNRPKDGSFNLEKYEATLVNKPNHGKVEQVGKDEWSDCDDDSDDDMKDSDSDMNDSDDSDDSMEGADEGKHKKRNRSLN